VSTIKVDTLQGTSGSDTAITLSGANATVGGTLAVTGVHTVGNNAIYTSDGGGVTQNLVQGLIKASMDLDGTGTIALNDSLNISGVTDNATGNYSPAYTNNFANVFYGWGGNGEFPSTGYSGRAPHCISDYNTTSSTRLGCGYQFALEDCEHVRVGWWGDLA